MTEETTSACTAKKELCPLHLRVTHDKIHCYKYRFIEVEHHACCIIVCLLCDEFGGKACSSCVNGIDF